MTYDLLNRLKEQMKTLVKTTLDVELLSYKKVREIPEQWNHEQLRKLLEFMEFDGWESIDDSELREYTVMALQEMESDEAAEMVLTHVLGDKLKHGQIKDMAQDMRHDKLWEEYQDIYLHAPLHTCGVILREAFPRKMPDTEVIRCEL